jgi:DNA-binding MarR family transcriptional regulator
MSGAWRFRQSDSPCNLRFMGPVDDREREPLIEALLKQVLTLAARTTSVAADVLRDLDLTDALASALWRLDPGQPPPSMRDLAVTLDCDPSTVTFLVDRLEERGLTARGSAAGDRRRKVITLTPRGVATRRKLIDALSGCSPLASLSPRDQRQLSDLLARAGADPGSFTCRATPDRLGPA